MVLIQVSITPEDVEHYFIYLLVVEELWQILYTAISGWWSYTQGLSSTISIAFEKSQNIQYQRNGVNIRCAHLNCKMICIGVCVCVLCVYTRGR
jgi:hypothetical protein